ncbi:MAG: GIY-YIG nuclease family protein [Alphaproteobacteria bacterium]|nr:GIY-YIG nuclease family protein [Alphaproteobacteria bacterium]
MKSYYVYIMSNQSNSVLYIGVTNDLIRRVYEHKNKLIEGFTKRYNLNKLVYFECVENVNVAIAREKQLKGWRRSKKDALIRQMNSQLEDLSEQIQ